MDVLDEAAIIDIEPAGGLTKGLLEVTLKRKIPWIGIPAMSELSSCRKATKKAGPAAFKAAVELECHTGVVAAGSHIAHALCTIMNYGYLCDATTAPGQWSSARLKEAINSALKEP